MALYNVNTVTNRDLYILAAGATGVAINKASDAEEIKQTLLFGGGLMMAPTAIKAGKSLFWDAPKWAVDNRNNLTGAFQNKWQNTIGKTNLYTVNRNALKANGFWATVNTQSNLQELKTLNIPSYDTKTLNMQKRNLERINKALQPKNTDNMITSVSRAIKRGKNNRTLTGVKNDLLKADAYKEVNKLMQEAQGLKGKRLAVKMREIDRALAKAQIDVNTLKAEGKIVRKTAIGRTLSNVKTKTGIRAVENKVIQATASKNVFVKNLAKGVKGGAGMALISVAFEAPNVVKTYKELGSTRGTKQLGKSVAKIGGETIGFMAGAKVGGLAGAKIGATIGTCIGGPIGTAIGGVVGTIIGVGCGLLGSFLGGKAVRAVVGKDELEIEQEKQTLALAKAAENNVEIQQQLATSVYENLEAGNVASEADMNLLIEKYNKLTEQLTAQDNTYYYNDSNNYQFNYTNNGQTIEVDEGLQALSALANSSQQFQMQPVYNPINNPFYQYNY